VSAKLWSSWGCRDSNLACRHKLSGGQEQRVSLARALSAIRESCSSDEPFAALDENLRAEIRTLVRSIQRTLGVTALFVNNMTGMKLRTMAHRIAYLDRGGIQQLATLRDSMKFRRAWKPCDSSGRRCEGQYRFGIADDWTRRRIVAQKHGARFGPLSGRKRARSNPAP